jgi:hypothetical protein
MEKQTKTEQAQQSEQVIKMKVRVTLKDVVKEDTKEKITYVSAELPDPFGDEDFRDVGIEPKWKDQQAIFKFKAKKALKLTDEIVFDVELKPLSYKIKNSKKTVTYPGLICYSPFDGRKLELQVKGENQRAVFQDIAYDRLGLLKPEAAE